MSQSVLNFYGNGYGRNGNFFFEYLFVYRKHICYNILCQNELFLLVKRILFDLSIIYQFLRLELTENMFNLRIKARKIVNQQTETPAFINKSEYNKIMKLVGEYYKMV